MKKIGKIIIIVLIAIVIGLVGYFGTEYLDKLKNIHSPEISLVYDDTETFKMEEIVLNKEDALKTWPYIFTIKNTGSAKGLYQILIDSITEVKESNVNLVLTLNDKELVSKKLSELENNVLYTSSINVGVSEEYKLYVYFDEKVESYEYKITLNAIKDQGPRF